MLEFFSSSDGLATALSAGATLLAVLLAFWLQARANLIAFSPNSTFFELSQGNGDLPPITIRSGQVMVQNLGRAPAEQVEVISEGKGGPAGYNIVPSVDHSISLTANGQWMVQIPFVAPKETVTIQILNGSNIQTVRSKSGPARFVPVVHQRLYPRWFNGLVALLIISGVFSTFYWIFRAAV